MGIYSLCGNDHTPVPDEKHSATTTVTAVWVDERIQHGPAHWEIWEGETFETIMVFPPEGKFANGVEVLETFFAQVRAHAAR
jgi:hypothetical protein